MSNIKILQENINEENAILREVCVPVKQSEFKTQKLLSIIDNMKKAAVQDPDGVALAAPQIGINKRIFVVAGRSYDKDAKWKPEVFINPEIIKASNKQELKHEGCLSVRGIYGDTWRATNVTVAAFDEYGNKFNFGAGGLIAHIFQHEMNHLDGILFIDHGVNLEEDPNWYENLTK
ncbi:MAG: peptide deformylase [Patescibacteria group bacterium]|nr:peptide deformylase [Patescibacteria group bacterium]